jgi:DNA-binding NarL/FixJ family response regulator
MPAEINTTGWNQGATMLRQTRVLIVDDHPLVRRGLAEVISAEADMEVCGEAADATEAVRLVEITHPQVMIVDLSLKSGHGIDLIEQIKRHGEPIKMIVVSVYDESLFAERALRAGAAGYLNKQEAPEKIITAIREVMCGEVALSERMANRFLHSMAEGHPLGKDPTQVLSHRELEVFSMLGQGMSTKQIAGKLTLSHKTIETHREKIKTKLNFSNASELARRAVQWMLERH